MGVIGLLLSAAAGSWRAGLGCAALMVGATAFVWVFPLAGSLGSHGSSAYMDAWGMVIFAPWLAGGCFVAGGLAWAVAALTAHQREAAEIAALLAEDEVRR